MAKWKFEYYDDGAEEWVELAGRLDKIDDTLNGPEEAAFYIPNTESNRSIIASDKYARISFDGNIIFTGLLAGVVYSSTKLKCVVYNECYEKMKRRKISGTYEGAAADDILTDICAAAGVTTGGCPSTEISVRFDDAYCFDAAMFLREILNKDYWATGTTLVIDDKGSVKSISTFTVSSRGVDRSKKRDKVIVKGVAANGVAIEGSAGTGDDVAVFREKKASDAATLTLLAEQKLSELNTDSTGAPLNVLITDAALLYSGDTVTINKAEFALNGSYRIKKITKSSTKATVEIDKAAAGLDKLVSDLNDIYKKYEDLGIYPITPEQLTPWTLNLQGLYSLYHLVEGEGTIAVDVTENGVNGTIVNGFWVEGSWTVYLNFDATGYVDCTNSFDVGGTDKLAVGGWVSPEDAFADANYVIYKDNQFLLQLYTTENKARFGVYIGGSWHYVTADTSSVSLYGRLFIMGVYTGSKLKLYVNGDLVKEADQTGNLGSSSANVYVGSKGTGTGFFHGAMAEIMLWTRALSDQEVQELYFFPLTRLLKKGEAPVPPIFPPVYSGILILTPDGTSFLSPVISETANFSKTALASESMSETPDVDNAALVSDSVSEAPAAAVISGFGYAKVGDTEYSRANNYAIICRFTANFTGTVTALKFFCRGSSSNARVKGVMYSDNAGAPNALLGAGNEKTPPSTYFDWVVCNGFSVAVTSGTVYWLGILIGSSSGSITLYMRYDAGSANQTACKAITYPTAPNPFSSPSYLAYKLSDYAIP